MRMQQRRKTATAWTNSNETLLAGEFGVESDTGKWKTGDGATAWASLPYQPFTAGITAAINAAVASLINGSPGALDTLNELAAALGNDANFATTVTNALAAKANTSSLAPVATAGTYTSLTGKPTLGTAAAAAATDFDTAGAATAAQAAAVQRANHTGTQAAATITGLATVATTGAYTNLTGTPTTLPPSGTAGGDLTGTYPNPTLAATAKPEFDGYAVSSGESTIDRRWVTSTGIGFTSGQLRLSYFIARKTETVANVRILSGNTAAGTPTHVICGIYSVDGSGNLTLVGQTADDTTIFAASNTTYTRALTASFTKTAGAQYAFAWLVAATSTPTLPGINTWAGSASGEMGVSPRICGSYSSGLTALPATIPAASINNIAGVAYAAVTP